jgi:hypothetical protein
VTVTFTLTLAGVFGCVIAAVSVLGAEGVAEGVTEGTEGAKEVAETVGLIFTTVMFFEVGIGGSGVEGLTGFIEGLTFGVSSNVFGVGELKVVVVRGMRGETLRPVTEPVPVDFEGVGVGEVALVGERRPEDGADEVGVGEGERIGGGGLCGRFEEEFSSDLFAFGRLTDWAKPPFPPNTGALFAFAFSV